MRLHLRVERAGRESTNSLMFFRVAENAGNRVLSSSWHSRRLTATSRASLTTCAATTKPRTSFWAQSICQAGPPCGESHRVVPPDRRKAVAPTSRGRTCSQSATSLALPSYLFPDAASQQRVGTIISRLGEIASLLCGPLSGPRRVVRPNHRSHLSVTDSLHDFAFCYLVQAVLCEHRSAARHDGTLRLPEWWSRTCGSSCDG